MSPQGDDVGGSNTRPLWNALSGRVDALDIMWVQMGGVVGLICLVIATIVTLVQEAAMGPYLVAICVTWTSLYGVVWVGRAHAWSQQVRRWGLPVLEALLPAIVLVVMQDKQGPEYALGSWVPPQLAALFLLASMRHLRADVPVAMGVGCAVAYACAYGLAVHPHIDPSVLLHSPSMQVVRCVSLVLMAGAASFFVQTLRQSVLAADSDVRQRELFGKYRLGEDIASGGMGRVVSATYAPEGGFERRVAIKLVHPHLARDPEFVERFRTEAELCSRLHHPGIVAALDFGRSGETWFFVMEYVDGRPLAGILKDHRLGHRWIEPRLVLAIGLQLADALDHAHAHAAGPDGKLLRVLHRDLTPSNILVDRSGQLKISDFGVARAIGGDESLITDHLVGKPSYVAPEVLRNQPVDERVDLWSLAVVLYEALTNQRLFKRSAESATLLAVIEDDVPVLDDVRPGLGSAWQLFFDQALARDPQQRFRTAADIARALQELQVVEGRATPYEIAELLAFGEEELPLDETTAAELVVPPPREFSATGAPPRVDDGVGS